MRANPASDGPLVSVVVPAYNAARHIGHTLYSLVTQTYPNIEIIVVDDGSCDATVPLVQEMARSHPQIRVIRQQNLGVAAARNRGVQSSRGEFIAPVDADDIWFPNAAERLASRLAESDEGVGVAYGWSVTINENGLPDGGYRCSPIVGDVFRTLLCHNFIGNASSTMIRRSCFDRVGGYDCSFLAQHAQGCEDWDLYLRLAEHSRFCVVPEFIVGYRRSGDSMSSNTTSMARSHEHLMRKTSNNHADIPASLFRLSTSSFYLHLAHECQRRRLPGESYRWLYQTLRKGPLFTLLRPGWYALAAKNVPGLLAKPCERASRFAGDDVGQRTTAAFPPATETFVAGLSSRRFRIRMRWLLENFVHWVVARVPSSLKS